MRTALQDLLEAVGLAAQGFLVGRGIPERRQAHLTACLIADIRMPGMSCLELQAHLTPNVAGCRSSSVQRMATKKMRLQARREGAVEFLCVETVRQRSPCSTVFERLWKANPQLKVWHQLRKEVLRGSSRKIRNRRPGL